MSTSLTASKVLAYKTEIEENLNQLRQETRDELCDTRHLANGSGQAHDRSEDAKIESRVSFNVKNMGRHVEEIRACVEALHRIDEGDFGICVECGEDIELNRLNASPIASRCISCQTQDEFLQAV